MSSLRGGSITPKRLPKDIKAKGLIESVNVTSSEEPKRKVLVINASNDREDVADEISAYHCDEGEYLFEQARKKWTDELQQVLPESCKITTDVNDTAVRKHQSVAKQLEICIQDLGKLVKVSSVTESKSVQMMAMTQQAFECCAEKAGGASSCKIDSTSASDLAAAATKPDEPKPRKEIPRTWCSSAKRENLNRFHILTFSCFNYVKRKSLTSLPHATKKALEMQRSNANSIMTKTELRFAPNTGTFRVNSTVTRHLTSNVERDDVIVSLNVNRRDLN